MSGTRFLLAEAALWGTFLGYRHVEGIRRDTYRTYASERAGAVTEGQPSSFYDDLGFYDSRLQHDQYAFADRGAEAALYGSAPQLQWEWQDEPSRLRYRDLRNSTERAGRNALFAAGAIVANHVFAAIHASRAPSTSHAEADERPTPLPWRSVDVSLATMPGRVDAAIVHRF